MTYSSVAFDGSLDLDSLPFFPFLPDAVAGPHHGPLRHQDQRYLVFQSRQVDVGLLVDFQCVGPQAVCL